MANRGSGTLSIIDVATTRTVAEHEVGRGLADLAALKEPRRLLAADQASNELLLLDYHDLTVRVLDRLKVSPDPVRLAVLSDGASCAVASRWSRRLTFVSIARGPMGRRHGHRDHRRVDLPFCPRELARLARRLEACRRRRLRRPPGGGRCSSPGGRIGASDSRAQHPRDGLCARREIAGDRASVSRIIWRRPRSTTCTGGCSSATSFESFEPTRCLRLARIGRFSMAAGSLTWATSATRPATRVELRSASRGELIVALVGRRRDRDHGEPRPGSAANRGGEAAVGRGAEPRRVDSSYVANRLDDTVSVIEIKSGMRTATISLGPRPEPTAAQRGERLFYSAKLSHDGWMSCHSCHSDGHTNNLASRHAR